MKTLHLSASLLAFAPAALSQTVTQVPLNYNFNGVVHAGESGMPDDPDGYRSISDRGLDFTVGVPVDPVLDAYSIVDTAAALDVVHIGNRNTVAGGAWAFDAAPDGDNVGTQPTWLADPDQTGPQTTPIGAPVVLETTSTASFLFQISNGGGSFDVTFDFQSGGSTVGTIGGGDWFGGPFPGTDDTDNANLGATGLFITEASVDLSAFSGESISAITFGNSTNGGAGIAVLAANITTESTVLVSASLPLNYNFNGVVHDGEAGDPDALNGYRSISDRGLDFSTGVPRGSLLDVYSLVQDAGELDVVHLGNRNTVDNGNWAFDAVPDGDNIGVQPSWLADPDQTGPQTSTLPVPVRIDASTTLSFLYQISNGGGDFDVTAEFLGGGSATFTLNGPDWFGGSYAGTAGVDIANPDNNLSITEGVVDLSASAGEWLTAITFSNRTNTNAGYAILAGNLTAEAIGTSFCSPAMPNSTGSPGVLQAVGSTTASINALLLVASDLPTGEMGYMLNSMNTGSLSVLNSGVLCLGSGKGRHTAQAANSGSRGIIITPIDLTSLPRSSNGPAAVMAGETWYFQLWHRDGSGSNFTDAVCITYQ